MGIQLYELGYDVTTLYFECEVEQEGALWQKGFSKDGKIGRTQILFCLMIDKDKNPIGYRIFKGDTFEGHTFGQALCDLKAQYQIDKVIVVADRGMLSRKNIDLTTENGLPYRSLTYFSSSSSRNNRWPVLSTDAKPSVPEPGITPA